MNESIASLRTWRIQSALMMSLPHVVRNITMPVLPLQITLAPLSLALILVAVLRMIGWGSKNESKSQRIFYVVGLCSTIAYLAVELYAIARGNGYLTSEVAVIFNQALSIVEFLAASLALTWWCLNAPKTSDKRSGNRSILALGVGFISPLLVQLVADALKALYPPSSLVLCVSSGAIAYAAASINSRWRAGTIPPVGVIVGLVSYQIVRSFALGVNAYYGFYSGAPSPLWYCLPFVLLVLVLLATRFPLTKAATGARQLDHRETATPTLEGPLAAQLSDRERAIVACSALGYSQKDIASMLGIAISTVSTYRLRAFKKLEIDDPSELQHLIHDEGTDLSITQPADRISSRTSSELRIEQTKFYTVMYILLFVICTLFSVFGIPIQPILPDGTIIYQVTHIVVWTFAIFIFIYSVQIKEEGDLQVPGPRYAEQTARPILLIAAGISLLWGFQIGQIPPGGFTGLLLTFIISFIPIIIYAASRPGETSVRDLRSLCKPSAQDLMHTTVSRFRIEMLQLFGAGLVLAKALTPYPPLWAIKPFLIGLIALASAWWFAAISKSWKNRCADMKTDNDRLLELLKEHGMGDLQALVVLDCINGASIKETCIRRSTTENTVKSYRKRAYRKYGVSCAAELKELLRQKLDTTKECTLHPR